MKQLLTKFCSSLFYRPSHPTASFHTNEERLNYMENPPELKILKIKRTYINKEMEFGAVVTEAMKKSMYVTKS